MQRREKILAALLVGSVLVWWGVPFLIGMVFGPIGELNKKIKDLDPIVEKLQVREEEMAETRHKMCLWRESSLPPDPYQAQRLYQEWLTDLSIMAGWTALKVTPDQIPSANAAYKAVRVTIKGEGTLEQVTTFLHYFGRVNLLHRVSGLKLENQPTPGARLKITLVAEGLCLPDAPPRTHLFPRVTLTDSLPKSFNSYPIKGAEGFPKEAGFEARIENEFVTVTKMTENEWTFKRGVDGTTAVRHPAKSGLEYFPVRPERKDQTLDSMRKALAVHPFTVPPPARSGVDPNDPVKKTKLMGSFVEGEDRFAWLYNDVTKTKTVVRKGDSISIGDLQGTVVKVEPMSIQFSRGSEVWEVDFGKDLRSMTRVSGPTDEGFDDLFPEGAPPGAGPRREGERRGGSGGSGGRRGFGGRGGRGRDRGPAMDE